MSDASLEKRAALYLRAERQVRQFFARHFDTLCAACGAAAAHAKPHLCCCTGVDCLAHIAQRPVLVHIVNSDPALAQVIADHVKRGECSLLAATGCALAWGRGPVCNTSTCSRQSACLRAAMPTADVVALVKSLRVLYDICAPDSTPDLNVLTAGVARLEDLLGIADQCIRQNASAFELALQTQTDSLNAE